MPDAAAQPQNTQKHRRLNVRLPARISTIDSERDPQSGRTCFRTSDETCHNVSRGGAFVMTEEPVRPGSRLLVELELPSGDSVQTIARVAWSRARLSMQDVESQSGVGIEFLGGAPEQLSALDRYLSSALRRTRPAVGEAPLASSGA
jgi:Tfp pilus assembly protein PilZ